MWIVLRSIYLLGRATEDGLEGGLGFESASVAMNRDGINGRILPSQMDDFAQEQARILSLWWGESGLCPFFTAGLTDVTDLAGLTGQRDEGVLTRSKRK